MYLCVHTRSISLTCREVIRYLYLQYVQTTIFSPTIDLIQPKLTQRGVVKAHPLLAVLIPVVYFVLAPSLDPLRLGWHLQMVAVASWACLSHRHERILSMAVQHVMIQNGDQLFRCNPCSVHVKDIPVNHNRVLINIAFRQWPIGSDVSEKGYQGGLKN